jgi:predicted nucleic acid-binding protein
MVWIYAFEADTPFKAQAQTLFENIAQSSATILVSHFLLAELLVLPVRQSDHFSIARYRRSLFGSRATEIIPFDTRAALRFATLRASHRVKQPDAIHLALAASVNADAFITTDDRLINLSISGIGLIGDLTTPLP